jgi:hypothetical protein
MTEQGGYTLDPSHFGIPRRDGGWIYAVRSGDFVKVGKTTDPHRRLLREAKTWCPSGLDEIIAKPFWNITKLEYSLHTSLAEHWHRGEWHKFTDPYWQNFFLDAFREFRDGEEFRDRNSIDFAYWMNGTNYAEIVAMQCEQKMTLPEWRQCRGMKRASASDDDWLLREAARLAWRDEDDTGNHDRLREDIKRASTSDDVPDDWSPLLKAAAQLAWRDGDDTSNKTP